MWSQSDWMQERRLTTDVTAAPDEISALAKGGRTNIGGFAIRLVARMPFLFVAGRLYGPDAVGRYALAVVVIELGALIATLGLKRGLALALAESEDEARTVWDALLLAAVAGLAVSAILFAFPQLMFPDGDITGFDRWFAWTIVAIALSDVALAALAYRHNVMASVTALAIGEPLTSSIAGLSYYYVARDDGLTLAYMSALGAALVASLVPMVKSYGRPRHWRPNPARIAALGRRHDRMGHAQRRPLHLGHDVRAALCRHLLHGAADQLDPAETEDQLRPDPRPRHHPESRARRTRGRRPASPPGRDLDHVGTGDRRADGVDPRRSRDGIARQGVRRGHRGARLPVVGRSAGDARRGERGCARLYRAASQPVDLGADAGVPDRDELRADPRDAPLGLAAQLPGSGAGGGARC